jgi:hypothetical protein
MSALTRLQMDGSESSRRLIEELRLKAQLDMQLVRQQMERAERFKQLTVMSVRRKLFQGLMKSLQTCSSVSLVSSGFLYSWVCWGV